jgi:hypothetical protein
MVGKVASVSQGIHCFFSLSLFKIRFKIGFNCIIERWETFLKAWKTHSLDKIFGIEYIPKCFYKQKHHFWLEFLFKPYLCFAAAPGKKEEKTSKTVEQGKKKWRRLTLSSLERRQHAEENTGFRQAEDNNL